METGKRLPGKVAIVTGGASGIGAETAKTFAKHGANVIICDSNTSLGESVTRDIEDAGQSSLFRKLDVISETSWTSIVEEIEKLFGKVDILANIAGISGRDPKQNLQTTLTAGGILEEQT